MSSCSPNALVFSVKNRCRVCFTCVRECPVKAIRIINGQAEVLPEKCIGCGNCVRVCSQGAKAYRMTADRVRELIRSGQKVVAAVAPSFPAEFTEIDPAVFVSMVRNLGFWKVMEVGFGADLVAKEYEKLLDSREHRYISSDCPAIVNYVSRYYPHLVDNLAPIVSPMVALTRVIHRMYGQDAKVVFIGPCIAKKDESSEIDEALTFAELRTMFVEEGIVPENHEAGEFDPPLAGKGSIFPVARGLMQTIGRMDDICEGHILVAEGHQNFKDAIREFEMGLHKTHHLELLCCPGCIMGPGMSKEGKRYARRTRIGDYVSAKLEKLDNEQWKVWMSDNSEIGLERSIEAFELHLPTPREESIDEVLQRMGKVLPKDHLNCGACGYHTCVEHAAAIAEGIAESEMCLPYTIEKLHNSIEKLNVSNEKLANAREALKQTEKLATMGQLSAGIAHELNNPLGVITMYSNILLEECGTESPIRKDLELIVEQADRCKKIVGGLLNFARKNQLVYSKTNIFAFAQRSLQSVIIPPNVETVIEQDLDDPVVYIDPDQMMQVFTNLEKNAIEAMPEGGKLSLHLSRSNGSIRISFSDTGVGIPEENMDKLFTPFFTTKSMGKGTGLGLPLIYGIIKMHRGQINIKSNADKSKGPTGTTFTIEIPLEKI